VPQQVDLVNRALQVLGTRTTITTGELANNSTNEAIQANIAYDNIRQTLLRMAPWDCALTTLPLTLITAAQGTPENMSPAQNLWTKAPPHRHGPTNISIPWTVCGPAGLFHNMPRGSRAASPSPLP